MINAIPIVERYVSLSNQLSPVLLIALAIGLFIGIFQTQYPSLYESFSNNDYETRTNLGNYSANVKYLLLKYKTK